ncbi:AAA family ATPase [Mycobacterium sp. PS03-16]|uniref:AAA family ATPase n=1 Tax=Mycobacterium sp. PS03-16 TaxID=2559611 RepID=UPI001ADDCAFA|nr:AAA family ATPase [Mycobacterium sp. PS03-16]
MSGGCVRRGTVCTVTNSVLDVDGRVVGRRRELAELRAAVDAAERDTAACILLSGPAGVGKSTLMQTFGAELRSHDCVFAYGRCRDGDAAPYAAIGDALASIVRIMESTGAAERDSWRTDLIAGMSTLTGVLDDLVPELCDFVGTSPGVAGLDAADARRRLHRAAIRLVSDTASYRPVVLAIDDLQWADRDSLLLLSELLTVAPRRVVLLGAHRTGEFDSERAGFTPASPRRIELGPLSRTEVEELLAAVGGRGVELADVVDEVHHRTGGNPLHVRQLLYRAQREGALIADGAGGRPRWDLRMLSSIEMTATTAEFLGHYLDQLRPVDRAVLSSLTCIGGEFDLDDATAAAEEPAEVVAQALWHCLEHRLLDAVDSGGRRIANTISRDARYRFSHDRVREAAREGLAEDARRATHLRMARRLVTLGDGRLFDAARHIGLSGGDLADDAERVRFVEVQHRAARKARAQASFPLALEYCRGGLTLLGANRWTAHFTQARELQLAAADAALLVGEVAALHDLLDEADRVLHEPADRARLAYLRLKGRVAQNRLREALEIGLRALDDLGEPLPSDAGKPRMANALVQMKLATRRWTTDRLLRLPHCTDGRVIEVQRILSELRSMSYIVRPNLFPLIVRKQLDLTLAHGHTPSSPLVLVAYGLLLVMTGDLAGSQRFGEVSLRLAERDEFVEARPQTVFMYLNFIRHWRHPLRDGLAQLRDAVTDALDQGDQEYAGFLAAVLLSQSFWVGRPLAEIDVLARTLVPDIRSQPAPLGLCQAMQQFCLNLMGRSEDPFLLAGESGYDERKVLPEARREGDEVALSSAATMKLGLHFWCGDYAGAVGVADEALTHAGGMAGTAILQYIHMTSALSRIHAAPADLSTAQAVRRSLALHRKWAAAAPANYAAPYALIEGVRDRSRGRHHRAERHLEQAMQLAGQHQLPLIGALAHEEAATLYVDTGRSTLGEHMLRTAYQMWLSQGMTVRAGRLARSHPWLLSRDLVSAGGTGVDPGNAHRVMRALAGARTPDRLGAVVVATVADLTGASRVVLLTGEAQDMTVRVVREGADTTTIDGPWNEIDYDRAVVGRVVDSGAPVTTAGEPARGSARRLRHRLPAILAVPIQVQERTIGVVYAEHRDPERSFTVRDEEAVSFLCDQAAAPLWNFQLEARLRAADEHRQSLMDVQSRFVPNELLRILDIDDLRRVRNGYRVERVMTVLISDIRGYTTLLEDMTVSEAGNLAMGFMRAVEVPIVSFGGMIQDVRGDEIVAIFEGDPDNAVRAGLAMLRALRDHNRERTALGSEELRVGIGINTGTVGVGLVGGVNRMVLTIIGDAVNLAARIESTNKRYGSALLISDATHTRLADRDQFDIRRMERVMVVNRRRPVTIHEVYDDDPAPLREAKRAAQPTFDHAFALFDAGDFEGARAVFERCCRLLPDDPIASLHLTHCEAMAHGELSPGQGFALVHK